MTAPNAPHRRQFIAQSMFHPPEAPIAKNRNTYAKRQREQDKKFRAEKKREKREQRRQGDKSAPLSAE
jgi:hypothetical protein